MVSRYQFEEKEIEAIEQARKANKDKRAVQRLKALELTGKGEKRGGNVPGNRILPCLCEPAGEKIYRDHGLEAVSGSTGMPMEPRNRSRVTPVFLSCPIAYGLHESVFEGIVQAVLG